MRDRAPLIEAIGLRKEYAPAPERPEAVLVFHGLSLRLHRGESLVLFGPNGSGKTTLVDILAGLSGHSGGDLRRDVRSDEIGYVPQDYRSSLLPWFTVRRNIALPLIFRGLPAAEAEGRAAEFARRFDLPLPLDRYPYQLSGGQMQMVSMLRGLLARPRLVVFDEAFSSLDYYVTLRTRERISEYLLELRAERQTSAVIVSHELETGLLLADRALVLSRRPMRIVAEVPVRLPWPRRPEMLLQKEFLEARAQALKAVQGSRA